MPREAKSDLLALLKRRAASETGGKKAAITRWAKQVEVDDPNAQAPVAPKPVLGRKPTPPGTPPAKHKTIKAKVVSPPIADDQGQNDAQMAAPGVAGPYDAVQYPGQHLLNDNLNGFDPYYARQINTQPFCNAPQDQQAPGNHGYNNDYNGYYGYNGYNDYNEYNGYNDYNEYNGYSGYNDHNGYDRYNSRNLQPNGFGWTFAAQPQLAGPSAAQLPAWQGSVYPYEPQNTGQGYPYRLNENRTRPPPVTNMQKLPGQRIAWISQIPKPQVYRKNHHRGNGSNSEASIRKLSRHNAKISNNGRRPPANLPVKRTANKSANTDNSYAHSVSSYQYESSYSSSSASSSSSSSASSSSSKSTTTSSSAATTVSAHSGSKASSRVSQSSGGSGHCKSPYSDRPAHIRSCGVCWRDKFPGRPRPHSGFFLFRLISMFLG